MRHALLARSLERLYLGSACFLGLVALGQLAASLLLLGVTPDPVPGLLACAAFLSLSRLSSRSLAVVVLAGWLLSVAVGFAGAVLVVALIGRSP